MTDLTDIKGIGSVAAEKIVAAGYPNLESLPNDVDAIEAIGLTANQTGAVLVYLENLDGEKSNDNSSDNDSAGSNASDSRDVTGDTDTITDGDVGSDADTDEAGNESQTSDASAEKQAALDSTEQDSDSDTDTDSSAVVSDGEGDSGDGNDGSEGAGPGVDDDDSDSTDDDTTVLETIRFDITSGAHKNRTLEWKPGNPSARFVDGLYLSLSTIGVNNIVTTDGVSKFNFIYGNTVSGAFLPEADLKLFVGGLAKKPLRRHQRVG